MRWASVRVPPIRNILRKENFPTDPAYNRCVANAHDGAAGGVGERAGMKVGRTRFGGCATGGAPRCRGGCEVSVEEGDGGEFGEGLGGE